VTAFAKAFRLRSLQSALSEIFRSASSLPLESAGAYHDLRITSDNGCSLASEGKAIAFRGVPDAVGGVSLYSLKGQIAGFVCKKKLVFIDAKVSGKH
jgi:hypothetical protein